MPRVDFRVHPTTHDIMLTEDGLDIQLLETDADEPALIAEDCAQTLTAAEGEWAWDIDFGLPLWNLIFQTGTSRSTVEGVIRAKLLQRAGVMSVPRMAVTLNRDTRKLGGWVEVLYQTGLVRATF